MMGIVEIVCNGSNSKPVLNNEEYVVILVKILKKDNLNGNILYVDIDFYVADQVFVRLLNVLNGHLHLIDFSENR
jgi:hypothetical protein